MFGPDARHSPVMLAEVLEALAPGDGAVVIDGTFGAGGYSRALLGVEGTRVLAIDRDPVAAGLAGDLAARDPRFTFVRDAFGNLGRVAARLGLAEVDGIVLDVGVSSMQLDDPARGFAIQSDGPLDMRMDPDAGETAADLVNGLDERELAALLYRYGEEPASRRIARAVVRRRIERPFTSTRDLAAVIAGAVPAGGRIHPATRSFQALRIRVNDELGELERALAAADDLLAPGGRLVVVSFHSLEDRVVKRFLSERSGRTANPSRHLPETASPTPEPARFRLLSRRPRTPGPSEVASNPRARSARLRAAERLRPGVGAEDDPSSVGDDLRCSGRDARRWAA